MLVHSPYQKSLEEIEAICQAGDCSFKFFDIPPFILSKLRREADAGNFMALLLGSVINEAYPKLFETTNLTLRMLRDLMRQGSMYTDKREVMESFRKHDATTLKPNTVADAARIGLTPRLIRALDAADGGLIIPRFSDTDALTTVNSLFCTTTHSDGTYSGVPRVIGTETNPVISIGGTDIDVYGANKVTLEVKFGITPGGLTPQSTVVVSNGDVFIHSEANYRQTRAIDFLLKDLTCESPDYYDRYKLILLLSSNRALLEVKDAYEYLETRRQLADLSDGFDTGYIINSEYTGSQPVSSQAYIRSLSAALHIYEAICSETFNIDIHDNTTESDKDSISAEGVDSSSGVRLLQGCYSNGLVDKRTV